jgi:hypothetical protein
MIAVARSRNRRIRNEFSSKTSGPANSPGFRAPAFSGSREEDQVCFEYLPLDVSLHGLGLTIPHWLVNRERLQEGDRINLNVPSALKGKTFHQEKIVWTRWYEALQGQVNGLSLEKEMPPNYPSLYYLTDYFIKYSA